MTRFVPAVMTARPKKALLRSRRIMASLSVNLNPFDVVRIGLAGDWAEVPAWLISALSESVSRSQEDLVEYCGYSQNCLLETTLKQVGLWTDLKESVRRRITTTTTVSRILGDALRAGAAEIDYVLGRLGIQPVYLKGTITSNRYYRHPWQRWYKDVDFLVTEREAIPTFEIIKQMGYVQGYYDSRGGTIVTDGVSKPVAVTNEGYELPRQTKLVPVECSEELAETLRHHYDGRYLRMQANTAWVPVSVEIHYALEADRRLPAESQVAQLDFIPNGRRLTAECEFLFLCFKAYVDIVVFGICSVKLVADALRVANHEREQIDWNVFLPHCRDLGLSPTIRYLLHHARSLYGMPLPGVDFEGHLSSRDKSPFEFGDFLPALVKRGAAFCFQDCEL